MTWARSMKGAEDDDGLGAWSVINRPGTNIDRRKQTRTVAMEVLSLGMPRTGTLSMQEALAILGYSSPYHFAALFENVRDSEMWNEALDVKYKTHTDLDWRLHFDQLLGHCGAVTDVPCAIFWKELMDAYPNAKVILVERDEDKWFRSISTLMVGTLNPVGKYVFYYTDPQWYGAILSTGFRWMNGFFGTLDLKQSKQRALPAYRAHNAAVRNYAAPDRILLYKLGSGWKPICDFLGKDIPDVPFPNKNEAATLKRGFVALIGKALRNSLINGAVVAGAVAIAYGVFSLVR